MNKNIFKAINTLLILSILTFLFPFPAYAIETWTADSTTAKKVKVSQPKLKLKDNVLYGSVDVKITAGEDDLIVYDVDIDLRKADGSFYLTQYGTMKKTNNKKGAKEFLVPPVGSYAYRIPAGKTATLTGTITVDATKLDIGSYIAIPTNIYYVSSSSGDKNGGTTETVPFPITSKPSKKVKISSKNIKSTSVVGELPEGSDPSFWLTSPTGGEKFIKGNNYTITWESRFIQNPISVYLVAPPDKYGSSQMENIAMDLAPNTDSYTWTVPAYIKSGKYNVLVSSYVLGKYTFSDTSDDLIIISDK